MSSSSGCHRSGGTRLAPTLRAALGLAGVAGASSWMLGCGAGVGAGSLETTQGYAQTQTPSGSVTTDPGFSLLQCRQNEFGYDEPGYLSGLRPDPSVDYVELRSQGGVLESQGSRCETATNVAACLQALDAMSAEPGFMLGQTVQIITAYHLRATRGDEVLRVGTAGELRQFLGAIDSLGDAELIVATRDYNLLCGESGGRASGMGFDVLAFTQQGCDGRTRHLLHVDAGGALSVLDSFVERAPDPGCVVGRRPEGLVTRALPERASLGAFFAGAAELEAASVPAFLRLARELCAHRAPLGLARRAIGAARDEVRHARSVGRLARSLGVRPRWPEVPVGRVRPLEAVALENTVEGCVRETYGALVAEHQALTARNGAVRSLYRGIARDETRHAELSWDVARWLEQKLDRAASRRVAQARRGAAAQLLETLRSQTPSTIDAAAGLPAPGLSRVLAERLDRELWQQGRAPS